MIELKYKVGDKVLIKSIDWYNNNKDENDEVMISSLGPVFTRSHSKYAGRIMTIGIVSKLGFYILEEDKEANRWYDEMFDTFAEEEVERLVDNLSSRWVNEFELPEGYIFKDENGNIINSTKIVLEKKKKEYPKTYEECCELLDGCSYNILFDRCETSYEEFLHNKLLALRRLIICRDAYRKLAGEEMGLDGPWEPDWNTSEPKYVIACTSNGIEKQWETTYCKGFAFPTEEMRDAFKKNFDSDIEFCKELL